MEGMSPVVSKRIILALPERNGLAGQGMILEPDLKGEPSPLEATDNCP